MKNYQKTGQIGLNEVVTSNKSSENAPYISPTPGAFPIIAMNPFPDVIVDSIKVNGGPLLKEFLSTQLKAAINDGVFCPDNPDGSEFFKYYNDFLTELANDIKDAGFNAVLQNGNIMYTLSMYCKERGMGLIAFDQAVWESVIESTDYWEKTKLSGPMNAIQILDEPKYSDWGDVFFNTEKHPAAAVERWDRLTFGYAMTRCYSPDKLALFNLAVPDRKEVEELDGEKLLPGKRPVGDWPQNEVMGSCATYPDYLDVLQRLFKPGVWSYDVYPFKFSKIEYFDDEEIIPSAENCIIRYDHFYESLQLFYNQSIKTGRPFWAYCMSVEHEATKDGKPEWAMPAPTVPMLKFEAFSAIACGAQGILYWKFGGNDGGRPAKDSTYIKSYAPVVVESYTADGENNWDKYDFKLKNTKIWYAAKEVNAEIHKYEDIFLGAKIVACGHTDNSLIHADKFTFQYGCIESITVTASNSPNVEEKYFGNGVLVSVVTTKALKHYMVIVSKRPFENTPLQIVFKKGYKGIFVNSQQDINSSHNADGKFVVSYDLAPGDWIIIESARDK